MLKELSLVNFRCFRDYKVVFNRDFNVIVGKNNSGKSTLVDALKLLANVERFGSYRDRFRLEERDIPFTFRNIGHDYSSDDSIVRARFSNSREIEVVFHLGERPHVRYYKNGDPIDNKQIIRRDFKQSIGVLPPVGTLDENETVMDREYLKSVMISHLTPRHLRDIWHTFPEGFEEFEELVRTTWPGSSIERPEVSFDPTRVMVTMFFREDHMTREIFWAGHGFQVWLQLMTHLVKLGRMNTLVLDEPDIYLHSDMQKKLVRICKDRSSQVIIATHAVDIIDEVEPEDVIAVDRSLSSGTRLSNVDELQGCISQLGSTQNLKVVHFLRSNTCLFVEGDDMRYLKRFAQKFNLSEFPKENFSCISIDGFSNWEIIKDVNWVLKNVMGQTIKCFLVLDRDYHSESEISEVVDALRGKGVSVHVWNRKEIENYLIVPAALYHMFREKWRERHAGTEAPLTESEFTLQIIKILDEMKPDVTSQIIGSRIKNPSERRLDPSTISSDVLKEIGKKWNNHEYRIAVVSGKDFFRRLNAFLMDKYRLALTLDYVSYAIDGQYLDSEIQETLREFLALVNRGAP